MQYAHLVSCFSCIHTGHHPVFVLSYDRHSVAIYQQFTQTVL